MTPYRDWHNSTMAALAVVLAALATLLWTASMRAEGVLSWHGFALAAGFSALGGLLFYGFTRE